MIEWDTQSDPNFFMGPFTNDIIGIGRVSQNVIHDKKNDSNIFFFQLNESFSSSAHFFIDLVSDYRM